MIVVPLAEMPQSMSSDLGQKEDQIVDDVQMLVGAHLGGPQLADRSHHDGSQGMIVVPLTRKPQMMPCSLKQRENQIADEAQLLVPASLDGPQLVDWNHRQGSWGMTAAPLAWYPQRMPCSLKQQVDQTADEV